MDLKEKLVAKWFLAVTTVEEIPSVESLVIIEVYFLGEGLATHITCKWFFSSMCA